MDIYLTEEELQKEEHLFKAHEPKYPELKGKKIDLKELKRKVQVDSDAVKPPPSC